MSDIVFRDRWGRIWKIPSGFPTDGMSYIFPVSLVRNRFDRSTLQAAVLHDYIYAMRDYIDHWPFHRDTADLIFFDALYSINRIRRNLYYLAVRIAGEPLWNSERYDPYVGAWLKHVFPG